MQEPRVQVSRPVFVDESGRRKKAFSAGVRLLILVVLVAATFAIAPVVVPAPAIPGFVETHTHPFLGPANGDAVGLLPQPKRFSTSTTLHLLSNPDDHRFQPIKPHLVPAARPAPAPDSWHVTSAAGAKRPS